MFSAHTCFPSYSQAQDNSNPSTTSSFQSKTRIIDNMPSRKATIGDIKIAYKQLGESGAKPIILITGLGATMDMWSPLLLEHYQTIPLLFLITEVQENQPQGQKNFQSADLQMIQRVCLIL
jgi:hypothetical protein